MTGSDRNNDRERIPENIDPERRIIQTLGRREVIPSLMEGVDNAIDGLRRHNYHAEPDNKIDSAEIRIRYPEDETDPEQSHIEIYDSCGGVAGDDLAKVLRPGGSTAEADPKYYADLPDAIGWAGVGAIRGALSIGQSVTFKSRTRDADHGWQISVTLQEYLDDEEVYREEIHDIEPGTSILRIEDLNEELEQTLGPDGAKLKRRLKETYSLFLGETFPGAPSDSPIQPDFDLQLYVNDECLNEQIRTDDEERRYDWSFIPMDDLYPRHLKNWQFSFEFNEPNAPQEGKLRVDVTAGILREKSDKRGLTVYVNRRKVLDGQAKGIERRFGFNKFSDETQGRLCIVISILTETHPIHAPTTDEKDTLRFDSTSTEKILTRVSRLGIEYQRKAGLRTKDCVPTAVSKSYPAKHPHAGNGGRIEAIDYSNRSNVRHKPGKKSTSGKYRDYPELVNTLETVQTHAQLGIFNPDVLPSQFQPAYSGIPAEEAGEYGLDDGVEGYYFDEFEDADFKQLEEPVSVDVELPSEFDIVEYKDQIEKYAEVSAQESQYYEGIEEYGKPLYHEELFERNLAPNTLEHIEGTPDLDDLQDEQKDKEPPESTDNEEASSSTFVPDDASKQERELLKRHLDVDDVEELDIETAYDRVIDFLREYDEIVSRLPGRSD